METDLEAVIRVLVKNRWPFRLHATYAESIDRMLNVFEKVNKEIPFNGLRWCFDHAETITENQLHRVKKLGGGIAVQFRMYYQGELYQKMYGNPDHQIPPIKKMMSMGIPVGMGTDATRISTFNPWMSIHWALTGKTIGGYQFWPAKDVLSRFDALGLYTSGSAWVSGEEKEKGKFRRACMPTWLYSPEIISISTQMQCVALSHYLRSSMEKLYMAKVNSNNTINLSMT